MTDMNRRYALRLTIPDGAKHTHYPFTTLGSFSLCRARAMAMRALYENETTLSAGVREAIRQRMIRFLLSAEQSAAIVGEGLKLEFSDELFAPDFYANILNYRSWAGYSDEQRLAIEFAERAMIDPEALNADENFWRNIRSHFSDAEIVDMAIMITTWDSHTRLYQALGLVNNGSVPLGYDGSRRAPLNSREGAVGTETAVQLAAVEGRPDRPSSNRT